MGESTFKGGFSGDIDLVSLLFVCLIWKLLVVLNPKHLVCPIGTVFDFGNFTGTLQTDGFKYIGILAEPTVIRPFR